MAKKMLCAGIILLLLLLTLCSCSLSKIDFSKYTIIYAESDGDTVKNAADKISALIPEAFISGDISAQAIDEKEILIGNTNRQESLVVSNTLRHLDFSVKYINNKVVICGGSPTATANAVDYIINSIDNNKIKPVDYAYNHKYNINRLTVSGAEIKSFNVISSATDGSYDKYIDEFKNRFIELTGFPLKEQADSLNIMLKCDSRLSPDSYLIKVSTGDITLCGANSYGIRAAMDTFFETILKDNANLKEGDEITGKLSTRDLKYSEYINIRFPLENTYQKLTEDKKLNIVYYGSSVTSGYGADNPDKDSWRAMTQKWFEETFPDAEINNYNSSISASGSMLGAFRCAHDVLSLNPDLVFVDFSINDVYCATDPDSTRIYFESIVRQIKQANPLCDIVPVYITDQTRAREHSGKLYDEALAAEEVAAHYKLSSVNIASAVCSLFDYTNDSEWAKYYIDIVHPTNAGYALYFDVIKEFLENELVYKTKRESEVLYTLPEKLTDTDFEPKMFLIDEINIVKNKNFEISSESYWKTANPYKGYLYPTDPNNQLVISFTGNNAALLTEYGSENRLVYNFDKEYELRQNQRGYHPLILGTDIGKEDDKHTLTLNVDIKDPSAPYIITALLVW